MYLVKNFVSVVVKSNYEKGLPLRARRIHEVHEEFIYTTFKIFNLCDPREKLCVHCG